MVPQIKRPAVAAIFGEFYANKLINLLNTCCSSPAISINITATCGGIDPKTLKQTYNVTASATYNTNIPGYTSLFGYVAPAPLPDWTNVTNTTLDNLNMLEASIFVSNITANVPVVSANLQVKNFTPGNYSAFVSDNRGNYSNLLTFNIPNCPGNPSGDTSSTPASNPSSSPKG